MADIARGAGASTALLDAHKLAEVILSSKEIGGNGEYSHLNDDDAQQSAGAVLGLLPKFHQAMMKRANQHVKDATRRLYLSNRSGWGVTAQRATLRTMGVFWPVFGRVSHPPTDESCADLRRCCRRPVYRRHDPLSVFLLCLQIQ